MNRRSPLTQAQTLLLAFALVAQATIASAAGQKTISIPSVPALGAAAPSAMVTPALPGAAVTGPSLAAPAIPGAAAVPNAALPSAPAALPAAEAASAASVAAKPEAATKPSVSDISKAVAPQLEAATSSKGSIDGSVQSGEAVTTILQGGKPEFPRGQVEVGGTLTAAQPSAPSAPAAPSNGLKPAFPASQELKGDKMGPAAPQGPAVKTVDGRFGYALRRVGLNIVAKLSGAVFSLPQAGPKLTASILSEAKHKDAILSDIDDTLGKYNTVLEQPMVDAIVSVRKQGKLFAAITDRPDAARKGSSQLGAFDTFSSVPAAERNGMILATNGGGKIYQYDAQGEPKMIYEEPQLPEAERAVVKQAAEVVKAQLAGLGTGLQTTDPKDPSKPMEAENHGPYGFSMILKGGTPESTVKQIAHLLEAEMRKGGLNYDVEGRMAKDPSLPPYVTFSKLNKSLAVKRIAALEKLEAGRTILIGDSMYAPKHADKQTALAKKAEAFGEKLSGRAMPLTGNATDRNMELSMPGALTLSVGGTADPRMSHAFVLDGKNAEATRRVLDAMASTKKGSENPRSKAVEIALLLALLAAAIVSYAAFFSSVGGVVNAPSQQSQDIPPGMSGDHGIEDLFR